MADPLPRANHGGAGTAGVAGGYVTVPDTDQALDGLDRTARAVGNGEHQPGIFVWRMRRALVFTRREARLPGFARAASPMASSGWPVSVRGSGGGACAVGPGTVQIALVFPRPRDGVSLDSVYHALATPILITISEFGVKAEIARVPRSFCSGRYDIAVEGRKIAGLAQQWHGPAGRGGYVIAAASVIIDEDPAELAAAINSFADICDGVQRCSAGAITALAREAREMGNGTDLPSQFSVRLRNTAAATSFSFAAGLGRQSQIDPDQHRRAHPVSGLRTLRNIRSGRQVASIVRGEPA